MTTRKHEIDRAHLVGKEFSKLYYKVMNSYSTYLHLFYAQDSTVVISESQDDDKPLSMQATTQENVQQLLRWMYHDVSVNPLSCVPQTSLNGSILLLLSGRIKRKVPLSTVHPQPRRSGMETYQGERFFTQALLLRKQGQGYYIKTDTLHVLSHNNSRSTTNQATRSKNERKEGTTVKAPLVKHHVNDSCCECHMELSTHMGMNLPESLTDTTPVKRATNDIEKNTRTSLAAVKTMEATSRVTPITINCSTYPATEVQHYPRCHPAGTELANGEKRMQVIDSTAALTPLYLSSFDGNRGQRKLDFTEATTPLTSSKPELTCLFAARLPMGISPATVNHLFASYGKLRRDNPVRVFTGSTNCYACVNFESECEMRKALDSAIKYGGNDVVTEIWKPRDRRGRRTGRELPPRVEMRCRPCICLK